MNNQMKWQVTWITAITMTLTTMTTAAQPEETLQTSAQAQAVADSELSTGETRYVTDLIYTPIRSGPGGDYRIVNKGLPSGAEVTYFGTTEDGTWAEVETRGGTRGYLRAQYLQVEIPKTRLVSTLETELENERTRASQLEAQLGAHIDELTSSNEEVTSTARELETTKQELAEIKRISANAIQLDRLTNELTAKLEDANGRNDLLKLENARLEDRVANRQRIEGIFAVLAGIFIALVVPRLTVKRRRHDSWR